MFKKRGIRKDTNSAPSDVRPPASKPRKVACLADSDDDDGMATTLGSRKKFSIHDAPASKTGIAPVGPTWGDHISEEKRPDETLRVLDSDDDMGRKASAQAIRDRYMCDSKTRPEGAKKKDVSSSSESEDSEAAPQYVDPLSGAALNAVEVESILRDATLKSDDDLEDASLRERALAAKRDKQAQRQGQHRSAASYGEGSQRRSGDPEAAMGGSLFTTGGAFGGDFLTGKKSVESTTINPLMGSSEKDLSIVSPAGLSDSLNLFPDGKFLLAPSASRERIFGRLNAIKKSAAAQDLKREACKRELFDLKEDVDGANENIKLALAQLTSREAFQEYARQLASWVDSNWGIIDEAEKSLFDIEKAFGSGAGLTKKFNPLDASGALTEAELSAVFETTMACIEELQRDRLKFEEACSVQITGTRGSPVVDKHYDPFAVEDQTRLEPISASETLQHFQVFRSLDAASYQQAFIDWALEEALLTSVRREMLSWDPLGLSRGAADGDKESSICLAPSFRQLPFYTALREFLDNDSSAAGDRAAFPGIVRELLLPRVSLLLSAEAFCPLARSLLSGHYWRPESAERRALLELRGTSGVAKQNHFSKLVASLFADLAQVFEVSEDAEVRQGFWTELETVVMGFLNGRCAEWEGGGSDKMVRLALATRLWRTSFGAESLENNNSLFSIALHPVADLVSCIFLTIDAFYEAWKISEDSYKAVERCGKLLDCMTSSSELGEKERSLIRLQIANYCQREATSSAWKGRMAELWERK